MVRTWFETEAKLGSSEAGGAWTGGQCWLVGLEFGIYSLQIFVGSKLWLAGCPYITYPLTLTGPRGRWSRLALDGANEHLHPAHSGNLVRTGPSPPEFSGWQKKLRATGILAPYRDTKFY